MKESKIQLDYIIDFIKEAFENGEVQFVKVNITTSITDCGVKDKQKHQLELYTDI